MPIFLLPLLLLIAACSTPPTANVVRFHMNQPMARGTVALVPANSADAGSLAFRTESEPVARELQRLGFVVVGSAATSQFVAVVGIDQSDRAGPSRQSGLTVGMGGSSGNFGIGSSVTVPVGQPRQSGVTQTTLTVRLNRNSDRVAVWEGRATKEAVSGTPAASAANATQHLAGALFRDFPGQSGVPQQVRL